MIQIQVYHISTTNTNFFVNCTNNGTGNESSSIKTVRIFVFIKQFVNFLSKHINKTWIFLRIIERYFFFFGEIKCKQGVKIFEKHPNKMEIFLRIVEGLFSWVIFCFQIWFYSLFFLKKYPSNNTKGGSAMKESYKSFDELPMMLSVSQVAKVLGISRTRSYELVNEKGFPKIKIGTRIVVPKDEFKLWIQKQIKKG